MLNILLIHLAGLASPGPDFFYVVRQSASHSIRAGILAAIGISRNYFLGGFFYFWISVVKTAFGRYGAICDYGCGGKLFTLHWHKYATHFR